MVNMIAEDLRGSILNSLIMTCITSCHLWKWINDHKAYPSFDRLQFDEGLAELEVEGLVYQQRLVHGCQVCGRTEPGYALTDAGREAVR